MSELQYIATFFTHFDAMKFVNDLKVQGISAKLSPVPRRLSSSCGTCVRFASAQNPQLFVCENIEQLARVEGELFVTIADHR